MHGSNWFKDQHLSSNWTKLQTQQYHIKMHGSNWFTWTNFYHKIGQNYRQTIPHQNAWFKLVHLDQLYHKIGQNYRQTIPHQNAWFKLVHLDQLLS
jgi:hypothetical protein